MSKVQKKGAAKTSKRVITSPFSIYWEKNNYIFLIAGVIVLFLGLYLISSSAWDSALSQYISPVILLVAYLIIFPLSIFFGPKLLKKKEGAGDAGQSQG